MKMSVRICPFDELSLLDLHDLLALRIEVFVVEQDCPYQDVDGKDPHCFQMIYKEGELLIATLRILPPGIGYEEVGIGRIVVKESHRGKGLGNEIMKEALSFIRSKYPDTDVKLSAQEHLESYYNSHGFVKCGEGYLEDGIPHIPMLRAD